MGRKSIRFVQGKGEIRLPLASAPFLFGLTGGKPVAVEELELWPGDRVGFRTDAAGAVDFLELQPPVSTSQKCRPAQSAAAKFRSRVTPGRSSTMAGRPPTIRLNRVDLPTLGRPTMTTVAFLTERGSR